MYPLPPQDKIRISLQQNQACSCTYRGENRKKGGNNHQILVPHFTPINHLLLFPIKIPCMFRQVEWGHQE